MISNIFRGQAGNQIIQAATAIAHARKVGVDVTFPPYSGKRSQFAFQFQSLFPFINPYSDEYLNLPLVKEQRFGVYQELPNEQNLLLQGYWQHHLYMDSIRGEMRKLFGIPYYEGMKDYVAIHIRRGDSLRFVDKLPQPTDRYLQEAMEYFPGSVFAVFSDDITWCEGHFKSKFPGKECIFWEPSDLPLLDMGEMASTKGQIIVNSTYSWCAAYLGDPNRTIICPHQDSWFGGRYKHILSAEGLMVPGWTQIKY